MTKKVLLIDPPFQKFMNFSKNGIPLGLLYLAGELKKNKNEVRVLDSDYNPHGIPYPFMAKIEHYDEYLKNLDKENHPIWRNIAFHIQDFKPDTVGISLISTKLKSGLRIAKMAKELGVKRVIVGGPHVTIYPQDALGENSAVDSVVQGEGEKVFEEAYSEKIIQAGRIKDINNLEWPARDCLIGVKDYSPQDLGFVMTARGCPGSCNFCCSESLWGRRVRFRDIGDVVEEIDSINSDHGTKKFYLIDDTFTLDRKRVLEFCDRIEGKDYQWSCLTRMDRLSNHLLERMIDSGCSMIKVGIESGSQRVLDLMNKGITIPKIENTAKLLNEFSMPWLAYIMVGVPGEKPSEVDMTMELMNKIKPSYISAAIYTPYPGTVFSTQEKGLDFAREEANHHSLKVLAGDIPREKILEFMRFADKYNANSNKAKEIYKC